MIGTGKQTALDLCDFIDSSPSPFHAVNSVAERLLEAGFSEARSLSSLKDKQLAFFRRDGALISISRPKNAAKAVRVVGAHTDSPNLRLKPLIESNKNKSLLICLHHQPIKMGFWIDEVV